MAAIAAASVSPARRITMRALVMRTPVVAQVRSAAAALGEDAHSRSRRVAARMPRPAGNLALPCTVEDEHDLGMRELFDPVECLWAECVRPLDPAVHAVPVVVLESAAAAVDVADRRQADIRGTRHSAENCCSSVSRA